MFRGTAYGLTIDSFTPLPALAASPSALPDVIVRQERLAAPQLSATSERRSIWATPQEITIWQPGVGTFKIRGGCEIVIDPVTDVVPELLPLWALGPALALILHQRGLCVLHASGVAVRDGAIAFLGGPGAGKSTTAAALYARRYGVVADDVLAVDLSGTEPLTLPGFPQLKLWPDSLAALGDSPDEFPLLHPLLSKRSRAAADRFPSAALVLKRIYVLTGGDKPAIDGVDAQQSFLEVVRHSYAASLFEATATMKANFQHSSHLVNCGLVRRITVGRSLSQLDELAALVERDLDASMN